jgi:hypothetical protein
VQALRPYEEGLDVSRVRAALVVRSVVPRRWEPGEPEARQLRGAQPATAVARSDRDPPVSVLPTMAGGRVVELLGVEAEAVAVEVRYPAPTAVASVASAASLVATRTLEPQPSPIAASPLTHPQQVERWW